MKYKYFAAILASGLMIAYVAPVVFKLQEISKYHNQVALFAVNLEYCLSPEWFDDLPEDLSDNLYVPPEYPVFRRIAAGGHGDLKLVAPSANDQGKIRADIVVDDVRALHPFFGLSASEGGWRIAIVDGAEKMNRNAANALLLSPGCCSKS